MNQTQFVEMLNATMNSEATGVAIIASDAGDNAADTVGFANRQSANGSYSEAFIKAWIDSAHYLLDCSEYRCDEAKTFFAQFGI